MHKNIVIVDRYPSPDNLYAYAFVHMRVKAYIKAKLHTVVYCLEPTRESISSYEFEGVKVYQGNGRLLTAMLDQGSFSAISVHFLTKEIWDSIKGAAEKINTYVWLHGSEIQDWSRRYFVYESPKQRLWAVRRYRDYYLFWRAILQSKNHKLHFIFVSKYFVDEVSDDLDINIEPSRFSVIHNFIDTDLFSYKHKPVEQRLNLLSIRPFDNTKYANDLTVKAILELSKESFFKELNIMIIGNGRLFDELVEPLKAFSNITLDKRFLTQTEIANMHKRYGVFLSPTRMDAQGVSRDEAMSSGLVPITSRNTAIPEFVSDTEGFMSPDEDYMGMVAAIKTLHANPSLFSAMSKASSERVRSQSGFSATIGKEIELLKNKSSKFHELQKNSVYESESTKREKVLRDAIFELVDEYNELKKENWRIKTGLNRKLNQTLNSSSYKIGRRITYPYRRISRTKIYCAVKQFVYDISTGENRNILAGSLVKYNDLLDIPPRKEFFSKTPIQKMTIATIMDDFTYTSFKHECNLVQLTPTDWKSELDVAKPDMLFIESAWRGKDLKWTNAIAGVPESLVGIIEYCRSHNIPTVFWNKEDPVHTIHFIKTASLFDFVFTTDQDSIIRYKEILGHSRVYLLPFAAQPAYNNPIKEFEREDKFNFAGSYYHAFKQRCKDFEMVMKSVTKLKEVDIFDRNFGKNVPAKYHFPEKYEKYVKGTLAYSEISRAYKGYEYAITMNTIKHSPTMFARRGCELLASNTITVGNYSKAMHRFFGDLSIASDSSDEITNSLKPVVDSKLLRDKQKLLGLRKVLEQHTYRERIERVASKVFTNYDQFPTPKQVTVFAIVKDQDQLERVMKNYERQAYESTKLVLLSEGDVSVDAEIDHIVLRMSDKKKLAKKVGSLTSSNYLAIFDAGMYYGEYYLTDLMLATSYSNADIIGKNSYFTKSKNGELSRVNEGSEYTEGQDLLMTHSITSTEHMSKISVAKLIESIADDNTYGKEASTLSIDGFNLCDTYDLTKSEMSEVDGYLAIDKGAHIKEIYKEADEISNDKIANIKIKIRKLLKLRKTYPAQEEI